MSATSPPPELPAPVTGQAIALAKLEDPASSRRLAHLARETNW